MNALPNRRIEEWKYTDLRNVVDADAVASAPTAAWAISRAHGDLDIDDLPKQVPFGTHGLMAALASSKSKAGPSVRVRKGETAVLELDLTEGGHGRALIVVEEGGSLTLIEKQVPAEFTNIAIEIAVGKSAKLDHLRLITASDAVRVVDYAITIAAGGTYCAHLADFGGKISRTELHITLDGEGAQAHLSGVSVLNGKHADITTHVTHAVGKTQSTQLFRYVAGGQAGGVYQGKVTVAEGANGSDSR